MAGCTYNLSMPRMLVKVDNEGIKVIRLNEGNDRRDPSIVHKYQSVIADHTRQGLLTISLAR